MGWVWRWQRAPVTLKVGFATFIAGMLVAQVGIFTPQNDLWLLPMALGAILFGLLVSLDVGGAAHGYAETLRDYRPMIVDFSESLMARPGFLRVFGLGFVVMGCLFAGIIYFEDA